MKIQTIFYIVAILFVISAVLFFTSEYLRDLPDTVKFILLILSVCVAFFIAEYLRGRGN